jgi:hypothetical protein
MVRAQAVDREPICDAQLGVTMNQKPIATLSLLAVSQLFLWQERACSQFQPTPSLPSQSRSVTWTKVGFDDSSDSRSGCSVDKIETSWAFANHPFLVEQNRFMLTGTGTAYADLNVRGFGPVSLLLVALVIEYRYKDGRSLMEMPMVAGTEGSFQGYNAPFLFEHVAGKWKAGLSKDSSATVQGVSNGIVAAECPTNAKITFAQVVSEDGSVATLASDGWKLGPTPRVIPFVPVFPADLATPPLAMLAQVRIDSFGTVTDILPLDNSSSGFIDLLRLLRRQMRTNWKFNPALLNGGPTAADLRVLFRLHGERVLNFPNNELLLSPTTLVEFYPDPRNPGKLRGRLWAAYEWFWGSVKTGDDVSAIQRALGNDARCRRVRYSEAEGSQAAREGQNRKVRGTQGIRPV